MRGGLRVAAWLLLWRLEGALGRWWYDDAAGIWAVLQPELSTAPDCPTGDPRLEMAVIRSGTEAFIGDAVGTYDRDARIMTAAGLGAGFNATLKPAETHDLTLRLQKMSGEGVCIYAAYVFADQGRILGVGYGAPSDFREVGAIKVGALDEKLSRDAGSNCSSWYLDGKTLAFTRWFGKQGNDRATLGFHDGWVDVNGSRMSLTQGGARSGVPSLYVFAPGGPGQLLLSTELLDEQASGCVFAATVTRGTVLGVGLGESTTATIPPPPKLPVPPGGLRLRGRGASNRRLITA